ncbi:hypothetical protein CDAR_367661 [Caerostris darwini]|uniref:Uncharacterized protein n=1 Tax=Caerostris darwini TaxID=1538125 RepID=A0AAV4SWA6_9ARAC|nr:hypothetical protein CDAR_367661 [Caerostris darwini]
MEISSEYSVQLERQEKLNNVYSDRPLPKKEKHLCWEIESQSMLVTKVAVYVFGQLVCLSMLAAESENSPSQGRHKTVRDGSYLLCFLFEVLCPREGDLIIYNTNLDEIKCESRLCSFLQNLLNRKRSIESKIYQSAPRKITKSDNNGTNLKQYTSANWNRKFLTNNQNNFPFSLLRKLIPKGVSNREDTDYPKNHYKTRTLKTDDDENIIQYQNQRNVTETSMNLDIDNNETIVKEKFVNFLSSTANSQPKNQVQSSNFNDEDKFINIKNTAKYPKHTLEAMHSTTYTSLLKEQIGSFQSSLKNIINEEASKNLKIKTSNFSLNGSRPNSIVSFKDNEEKPVPKSRANKNDFHNATAFDETLFDTNETVIYNAVLKNNDNVFSSKSNEDNNLSDEEEGHYGFSHETY